MIEIEQKELRPMRPEDHGYVASKPDETIAMIRECSLISACINGGARQVQAAARVCRPDQFTIEPIAEMFQAMIDSLDAGKPIDFPRLLQSLMRTPGDEARSAFRLLLHPESMGFPTLASNYAFDIATHDKRGEVKTVANEFVDAADELDPEDAIGAAQASLESLQGSIATSRSTLVSDASEAFLCDLEKGHTIGGSTGFKTLDEVTGGLQCGRLITIAARSGDGKTSLAMQIAWSVASRGGRVACFSYEMPAKELAQRALAYQAEVNLANFQNGYFTKRDHMRLKVAAEEFRGFDWHIFDDAGLTVDRLCSEARMLHAAAPLSLVVVDYVGIMPVASEHRRDSTATQIGAITNALKSLAMATNVPVMALCQVNREGAKEEWLKKSHLRDSSSIENDSDQIWLIQSKGGDRFIDLAKNRSGPVGRVPMKWVPQFTKFEEVDDVYESVHAHDEFSEFS